MNSGIQVVEKPDWVSWDEIKQCLVDAHATNRERGINMAHYQWPAEKIREFIGSAGVMLVALDGTKVVGTAAIAEKEGNTWYAKGRYAYMCFGSVLPEYNGRGIYKNLVIQREKIAKTHNYSTYLFDTHECNQKIQSIAISFGYRLVGYFRANSRDHFNVIMVKWSYGCPYPRLYCRFRYLISKIKSHLLFFIYNLLKNHA